MRGMRKIFASYFANFVKSLGFRVTVLYEQINHKYSSVKVILSLWAGPKPVSDWIWPVGCGLTPLCAVSPPVGEVDSYRAFCKILVK